MYMHACSLPASSSSPYSAAASISPSVDTAAEMHEATRRVLGVLLRHLDGFDSAGKRTVVIGATNRKQVGALGALSWQGAHACLLAAQTNRPVVGTHCTASSSGVAVCGSQNPALLLHSVSSLSLFQTMRLMQDLDPALISRFSTSVNFGLPSEACRCACASTAAALQHVFCGPLLAQDHGNLQLTC